jgi:hypothetical protein
MNALIDKNKSCWCGVGHPIAQISANQFPVAKPLAWVECSSNTTTNDYHYVDGKIEYHSNADLEVSEI